VAVNLDHDVGLAVKDLHGGGVGAGLGKGRGDRQGGQEGESAGGQDFHDPFLSASEDAEASGTMRRGKRG
jgi:hypothetical protein